MTDHPLCRLVGHSYQVVWVDPMHPHPDIGVVICKRRYCAHTLMSFEDWGQVPLDDQMRIKRQLSISASPTEEES